MKVAVIGPLKPYRGGISHYNSLLCKELSSSHDVLAISWKRRYPAFLYPTEQMGARDKKKLNGRPFILDCLNPFTWITAVNKIWVHKSDLLIFHWVSPFLAPIFFFVSFFARLRGTKVLAICHNVIPHERRFFDSLLTNICFSAVDRFIVHSKRDLKDLRVIKKDAKAQLGFMPLFSVFEKKKENKTLRKKLDLENNVLLFFGLIREYKGLKYLIEAMPEILKKHKVSLLVVGEFWEEKEYYLNLIDKLGLDDSITLIDHYVSDSEVSDYFAISDILVCPYVDATQSAVVQTAYALDKPVICTDVGGLSEVVHDGKTGYVVNAKNSKALAKAINTFYTKKQKNSFTNNVIKEKKNYSWSRFVKLIESFQ